jgi:hypothetical protein
MFDYELGTGKGPYLWLLGVSQISRSGVEVAGDNLSIGHGLEEVLIGLARIPLTFHPTLQVPTRSLATSYYKNKVQNLPALREMINSRKTPSQMVRLLICRGHCHSEPDIFRDSCHSRDDGQRLVHRPLCPRYDRRIKVSGSFVHIITP